jgi:hypothetical protein
MTNNFFSSFGMDLNPTSAVPEHGVKFGAFKN